MVGAMAKSRFIATILLPFGSSLRLSNYRLPHWGRAAAALRRRNRPTDRGMTSGAIVASLPFAAFSTNHQFWHRQRQSLHLAIHQTAPLCD